jgi:ABC-type multidrug transport system ATPase subunit
MTSLNKALTISRLIFGYDGPRLFNDWSAEVPEGLTWIHGDEGSGKSTLLRLLSGTLHAQAGDLNLQGTNQRLQGEKYASQVFLTEPRREDFDQMTPLEYFDLQRAKYQNFNPAMLEGLQGALDLTPHLNKKLFMLSNGSKRKVWLAAAFASGAPLTLIDDPFSALDRPSIKVIHELLEDAASQTNRIFVVADYEVPSDLAVTKAVKLSPLPASH